MDAIGLLWTQPMANVKASRVNRSIVAVVNAAGAAEKMESWLNDMSMPKESRCGCR